MLPQDVKVGGRYAARINGRYRPVVVVAMEVPFYLVENLITGRRQRVTFGRLRPSLIAAKLSAQSLPDD